MSATIAERFGANLARARARAGLSQEEVAIRASLHRTEVGLLERGERIPRVDTAAKLAGALGVPVADLLAGIEWTPGGLRPGGFVGTNHDALKTADSADRAIGRAHRSAPG